MSNQRKISRRGFLGQASCAAVGTTALFNTALSMDMFNTLAAPCDGDDYRALVCIFLSGGADTFNLLKLAQTHGARVALFGRKINLAESPLDILALMRQVIEGALTPDEAVQAYHDTLGARKIAPKLSLDVDRKVSDPVLADDL